MDSAGKKQSISKAVPRKLARADNAHARKVKQLFDEWLQDSSGYDEETWPELKRALNENHSKSHNLFDE